MFGVQNDPLSKGGRESEQKFATSFGWAKRAEKEKGPSKA
jgi:hypothetical protein